MFELDKEFYSSPYYFFLRDKGKNYNLYFSCEDTLTEARKKDEMVKVPKNKIEDIKKYLNKLTKTKKKKDTKKIKGELEELINIDGAFSNSKIPILDPRLHPKKTMDQTVAAARITNDPIARGYRTYYGESVEEFSEIDLSKAYGFDEISGETPNKAVKTFDELGVDDPIGRAEELGWDPNINQKKKEKDADIRIRLVEKNKLDEIRKKKMLKMVEDILMNKKSNKDSDLMKKELGELDPILKKNINSLMKQAEKRGFSKKDIIKILNNEQ
jgi:hypothetical protein